MISHIAMRNTLKLAELYPPFRIRVERVLEHCDKKGWVVLVTAGGRTFQQQDALVEQRFSKAPGGRSWHNYGLAVDICFMTDDGLTCLWSDPRYAELGAVAEQFGLHYRGKDFGSDLNDIYHYDANFGLTMDQLHECWNAGGKPKVWEALDAARVA